MKEKYAILATGGIDSTVLLYRYAKKKPVVISVDYGQIAFNTQQRLIKFHCKKNSLKYEKLKIKLYNQKERGLFEKSFVPFKTDRNIIRTDKSAKVCDLYKGYWIEGRNYFILLTALAYCSENKIHKLITGHQIASEDWNNLGNNYFRISDITPMFISICNVMAGCGFKNLVSVEAPFLIEAKNKLDIIKEAIDIGIDLNTTCSCHFGNNCSKCAGCIEREKNMRRL